MIYLYQRWDHVPEIIKLFYKYMFTELTLKSIDCAYLNRSDVGNLTEKDTIISDIRLYIPRIGGVKLEHTKHKIFIINAEEFITLGGSYLYFANKIINSGRCVKYLDYSVFNYTALDVLKYPLRIMENPNDIIRQVYASDACTDNRTFGLMYYPSLEFPSVSKETDVIFCGNINGKRQNVLHYLTDVLSKYTFYIQPHISLDTYISHIRKSKIAIIVSRFHDFCDFDMYRISLMIPNNVIVIHENINRVDSRSSEYDKLKKIVDFCDIRSFPEKIRYYLEMKDIERDAICNERRQFYKEEFNMTSRMHEIINVLI